MSCGVRGPVSVHQASSLSPVEIESLQITKSVNGEKKDKGAGRASDTMGMKHFVRFGLYEIKGSINVMPGGWGNPPGISFFALDFGCSFRCIGRAKSSGGRAGGHRES